MVKRYRRPKVTDAQIKAYRGIIDGEVDNIVSRGRNIPKCDSNLIMNHLFSGRYNWLTKEEAPSLLEELEARGYDLDTFKFSIEKKKEA